MFITVTNFGHTVLGPEHIFELLCTVFWGTIRLDDTFLLVGQGAEHSVKNLWQFVFSFVYKGPHESSFPAYDDGAILTV